MPWQSLKIWAPEQSADAMSDALMELGALSASIEDAGAGTDSEQELFGEPGEPDPGLWDSAVVCALFPAETDVPAVVRALSESLPLPQPLRYTVEDVEEQDWVRLTQAQFEPIRVSDRLWVVPSWHDAPNPDAVNLEVDPGLAFGTGSHPTTHLCLRWLDENIRGGESVLDYGCGSGILAIAALKLGARSAVGVDIDPLAVQASRDNAERNGVVAQFCLPSAAPSGQVDVVVANILANPLKVLAPVLAAAARPGGRLVLSGILSDQAEGVIEVYRDWFELRPAGEEEGWVCLAGTRR